MPSRYPSNMRSSPGYHCQSSTTTTSATPCTSTPTPLYAHQIHPTSRFVWHSRRPSNFGVWVMSFSVISEISWSYTHTIFQYTCTLCATTKIKQGPRNEGNFEPSEGLGQTAPILGVSSEDNGTRGWLDKRECIGPNKGVQEANASANGRRTVGVVCLNEGVLVVNRSSGMARHPRVFW